MRIAVNTGEALVTLGARPSEGEAMVAGDVVNTAARLQAAAPVNGVLVGEATTERPSEAIEYREPEPVARRERRAGAGLGGGRRPRSRFGVDVDAAAAHALVGREPRARSCSPRRSRACATER